VKKESRVSGQTLGGLEQVGVPHCRAKKVKGKEN
jgi:hypothetical protein